MEITVREHPEFHLIRPEGDLGAGSDQALRKALVELGGDGGPNVLLDMRRVGFLDSDALGTLVWGMKNMRERGGDLRLFGLTPFVKRLFALTGLDQAFRIHGSEAEGATAFTST